LDEIQNIAELNVWIDEKINGNTSRLGWTTDLWSVWDMTTIYVQAFLDSHPTKPLCCGPNTAYSPLVSPASARDLVGLTATCIDHIASAQQNKIVNPCLDSTFYNDFNTWFEDLLSGRSVLLQGFSTYISNLLEMGGTLNGLQITSAILGTGNQPYLFTDAFVLSQQNCVGACVDAAAIWMNWQRLQGQLLINLGYDLTPQRPRYLVSCNTNFYTNPLTLPYNNVYHYFFNSEGSGHLQIARPLDTVHYTSQYCEQYKALTFYLPTGSSCNDQGFVDGI